MTSPRKSKMPSFVLPAGACRTAIALAFALPAMGALDTGTAARAKSPVSDPSQNSSALTALQSESLGRLYSALDAQATRYGVSPVTIRLALSDFTPNPQVSKRNANQPEHVRTTGDYLAALVTTERIELGRSKLKEHRATLVEVNRKYRVDPDILVALWGIESRFGTRPGKRPVVRSLATLALNDARRRTYWQRELLHALRIVEHGDIPLARLVGSWAGAMGHTQFMPSSFHNFAVDFDGDGRRDIWRSAADALASAANYLARSGWQPREPWGFEILLPANFDYSNSGPKRSRSVEAWRALGVSRPAGRAWPTSRGRFRLLLPAGADGPAFLVGRNFKALLRYNPATSYALSVGHLADRLAGKPPIHGAWPTEAPLSSTERRELQHALNRLGFDTGGQDGLIGKLTRAAIRSYQKAANLTEDGYPGRKLLQRIRAESATGTGRLGFSPR